MDDRLYKVLMGNIFEVMVKIDIKWIISFNVSVVWVLNYKEYIYFYNLL